MRKRRLPLTLALLLGATGALVFYSLFVVSSHTELIVTIPLVKDHPKTIVSVNDLGKNTSQIFDALLWCPVC